jgi:FHA domain
MAHAFGETQHSISEEPIHYRWSFWLVCALVAGAIVLLACGIYWPSSEDRIAVLSNFSAVLGDVAQLALGKIMSAWNAFHDWTMDHYQRVPTLMLGLAALAVLPVLALLSSLLGAVRAPTWNAEATRRLRHGRGAPASVSGRRPDIEAAAHQPPWPMQAWLEVDGHQQRFSVGTDILQIGRDVDTDVRLIDPTVHRYHATIHRSEDGPYIITDLAAPYGNGVFVNGGRITSAALRSGDQIHLGKCPLKFMARPM